MNCPTGPREGGRRGEGVLGLQGQYQISMRSPRESRGGRGGEAPGVAAQQAQCGEEAGGCIDHVVRGGGFSGEAAQVGGDVGEVR